MKGKVESVSEKNKGIRLGDVWYNATEEVDIQKSLYLKEVEINIIDKEKRTFDKIKVLGQTTIAKSNNATKDAHGKGASLNTAVQILKFVNTGKEGITSKQFLEKAKEMAKEIYTWTNE